MPKKDFWALYKLRSLLEQLRCNRSFTANVSQASQQRQFQATAVSKVGHGYSMQQGLRFLSISSKQWTKLDTNINGGKDKVQQSQATTTTRLSIAHWVKWILGSILSLMLPFWINNWGKLQRIEREAEMVLEEVENVAEVVERVALVAEKVSDDVANELPENSKLKEKLLLVERVSKVAAQEAQLTKDVIHKVETLKQDLWELETSAEPVNHKIANR